MLRPLTSANINEPQPSTSANINEPQPSTSANINEPQPSTSANINEPQPSTSANINEPQPSTSKYHTQTDIIFENDKQIMIIQKGTFQRQKRFQLQDHLFNIKIKLKNEDEQLPFLKDILDFIEDGLLHMMHNIKPFYNAKDDNLAFLTLYQKPMVTGLNSGMFDLCSL